MSLFANFFWKRTPYDLKELAKILDASYTKEHDVDEDIQKIRFSPSQIGYGNGRCARYWVMLFQGAHKIVVFDPVEIDRMEAGTAAHERIQRNFANSGLTFDIETVLEIEDPPIKGYVDAIIRDFNGFDIPIEIKTTRTEAFTVRRHKQKGPDYQTLQLLIYMYFGGYQHGLLMYEDKNDHEKILVPVELNDETRTEIEKVVEWMRVVYNSYKESKLPERVFRSNAKECKSCPLRKHCADQPKGDIRIEALDYSFGY